MRKRQIALPETRRDRVGIPAHGVTRVWIVFCEQHQGSGESMRPRLLIADEQTLVMDAIGRLLSPDYEIVGKVTDGQALVSAARELAPDVILLDVALPLFDGLDAGRRIKALQPYVKLVYLTMIEDPHIVADAFRAGASAYVLKRSATAELVTAMREALNDHPFVTSLVTHDLVGSLLRPGEEEHARDLTPRQREVLHLIAEGRSMKEAASRLNVTPRTIAFHKYQMMADLHIKTTAELIRFAVARHLV